MRSLQLIHVMVMEMSITQTLFKVFHDQSFVQADRRQLH